MFNFDFWIELTKSDTSIEMRTSSDGSVKK